MTMPSPKESYSGHEKEFCIDVHKAAEFEHAKNSVDGQGFECEYRTGRKFRGCKFSCNSIFCLIWKISRVVNFVELGCVTISHA